MHEAMTILPLTVKQDEKIRESIRLNGARLLNFIKRRVPNEDEAEDILQDVYYQLVQAVQLTKPIELVSSWMFTVARNKITDLFRKKKEVRMDERAVSLEDSDEMLSLSELLPSLEDGPDAAYARTIILEELEAALEELPQNQRWVFFQHEIEGRSFKELAQETGLTVNTLISRKRYAVMHLRERLQDIYTEFIND